ncbi:MAG: SLC13 family permease [Porticoccaceae bacterium]
MEWQGWFALTLTFSVLVVLATTRLAPHVVMMSALTILSLSGVISTAEALSGFSNSGLITVAAMFVVAAGIQASGGAELIVNHILGRPKTVRGALGRLFAPLVTLAAFINNTPVVATMIPAVISWSRKINIPTSKLMIPLSYTSILGGTLTLVGTSTNLVVDGQYQALTGEEGLSLFSITAVGLPVAIIGLAFMWLAFPRLLPDRSRANAFANLKEFTVEVMVAHKGPLVGKSVVDAGLRNLQRVYLVEVERDDTILSAVSSEEILRPGDRLVFAGDTEAVSELLKINGLVPSPENGDATPLSTPRAERRLVEAVVSPHCAGVGSAIRDARFRDQYGAVVLAVARNGERVKGNLGSIILEAGDTLLLEARPAFVARQRYNKDFLLISDLDTEPLRHDHALLAWAILIGLITAVGFGFLTMLNAALLGAGLMIFTGCCSLAQAEKSLDISVILTIAASFALGAALQRTGVAAFIADNIITLSDGKYLLLLILVYITVSLLTELITNNAATLIMLPIALEVTAKAGFDNLPFVFAVMMAASASFATPVGYQCNLMVYGPGGYRFSDFLRVGIPMNLVVGVASVATIYFLWPHG